MIRRDPAVTRRAVLEALRAEAARGGSDVQEAARVAGVRRGHVYRLARRYEDVGAALRAVQALGGQGRSQRVTERARSNVELAALATQLLAETRRGPVLAERGAAARLVALARAHGLLPPERAEVSPQLAAQVHATASASVRAM